MPLFSLLMVSFQLPRHWCRLEIAFILSMYECWLWHYFALQDNVVIFLHGFLGTGEDWIPIMKAISRSAKCISIDLPGHGGSKIQNHGCKGAQEEATLSIEIVADVLYELIQGITPFKVTLVGYSMGARIALHMALRLSHKVYSCYRRFPSIWVEDFVFI